MNTDGVTRSTSGILTFQDFEKADNKKAFILDAIKRHKSSTMYQIACDADLYDAQNNKTINDYVQKLYDLTGSKIVNFTASNNKIASNFFHRLNTQRNMYSLGAGISFVNPGGKDATDKSMVDTTKEMLGNHFDHDIQVASYYALIHGMSFCFWNLDRLNVFPLTQFVPLWDEEDGTLKAGARFWRLSKERPMIVVLYEIDGYTKFITDGSSDTMLLDSEGKKSYKTEIRTVPADGYSEVVGSSNYGTLPIIPMYGSKLRQSTLVGMREAIDSYDLIRSGFANDLTDCAQIYWIVKNAGGMGDADLARLRDQLLLTHMANVDSDDGGDLQPYTQEVPYQARKSYLEEIRNGIYEDFGALDVHNIAAGSTNDHIDAAYQPMDEEASDFEFQISECIQKILALQGIEDTPVFRRTRISNQKEQVDMVLSEAQYLDHETILRKLPNISPDEIAEILKRIDSEELKRFGFGEEETDEEEEGEEVEI